MSDNVYDNYKTSFFESISQYDKELKSNGNLCSIFSLISAWNFMENNDVSSLRHENNIKDANNICNKNFINSQVSFEQLLKYSNIDISKINVMLKDHINFTEILPQLEDKFCAIILKNSKYFVIMRDNNKYVIRDCHELIQYNFTNIKDLIEHLINIYQFGKEININGYRIPEFDIIEYVVIKDKFKILNIVDTENDNDKIDYFLDENGEPMYFNYYDDEINYILDENGEPIYLINDN